MNLLQRHVLKRVFLGTVVALASAVSVFATTQVLNHVDVLITSGAATVKSLELAIVAMPALIEILLPLAFLLGAIRVFATMNADSELAALEAAGGGPSIVTLPIYGLSLLFALTVLPLSLFVEPLANRAGRGIIADAGIPEFLAVTAKPGTFASLSDGLFVRIEDRLKGGAYSGLIFVDMRDPADEKIFYAKGATIAKSGARDFLYLNDGVVQTGSAAHNNLVSVKFASYAVDLTALAPRAEGGGLQLKDRSTEALLSAPPGDPLLTMPRGLVAAELHRRFSDWLYAFAFGAIALYFTAHAKAGRRGRFGDVAAAILTALIVRGLGFVALSGSGTNEVSAVLVYAVPLATFAVFAWAAWLRNGVGRGARRRTQAPIERFKDGAPRAAGGRL